MLNEGKEFEKREGLKLYATMDTRELHVHVCSILVLVLHVDMYVMQGFPTVMVYCNQCGYLTSYGLAKLCIH